MKARIIDPKVTVYSDQDLQSPPITELSAGTEVEIGGVTKKAGKSWVFIDLPTGQRGYLPGDTRIFHIKPVKLLQKNVDAYAEPSMGSFPRASYKKGDRFYLTDTVAQGGQTWVKVRDASGVEGFIDGKTRIKAVPETLKATKAVGQKNMLHGGLWCLGGTLVTAVTYGMAASSSSGGTYFVAWGAILFGGIQLLKGIYQFLTADV